MTQRLYEAIADRLAGQINSGELAAGSLLPSERELTETFGASRTSVREALLSLQASGLIALRTKARARVTPLNSPAFLNQLSGAAQSLLAQPSGVADFQEARMLFECGLARYAARHASPKEIDRLGAALAQNRKAIGRAALFVKTDLVFHDVLAEVPRNPIFSALNAALSEWLLSQRKVSLRAPVRGAMRRAYEGHEAVYAAIAAHDAEAADRAMAEHLRVVAELYTRASTA
jgi:GntR family transcriptional regulator, sialic acid-inducible nan operon repressor